MNPRSTFILAVLLITASPSAAARPDSFEPGDGILDGDYAAGFGDPTGNGILGGDYGAGLGDPIGDYSKGGTFVCREKGPCYMKKLTCPDKCFKNISTSGKGFEGSAGAGGCTMDCKEKCIASC